MNFGFDVIFENASIDSPPYNGSVNYSKKFLVFPEIKKKKRGLLEKVTEAVLVFQTNFIQNGSEWKYKSLYC